MARVALSSDRACRVLPPGRAGLYDSRMRSCCHWFGEMGHHLGYEQLERAPRERRREPEAGAVAELLDAGSFVGFELGDDLVRRAAHHGVADRLGAIDRALVELRQIGRLGKPFLA